MRILVIADDEGFLQTLPAGPIDLLISCGDLPDNLILEAGNRTGCQQILAVKGNHDSSGDFTPPIKDIHLDPVQVGGLKIGGFNGAWKYKPRGNFLFEQSEVNSMLSWFPAVDIFVAHNSPRKIHDREDDAHLGFEAFNKYIDRTHPKLFLHGHQHVSMETEVGSTLVVGIYGSRVIKV